MKANLIDSRYPLDSLGVKIEAHWREHRPTMYRDLQRQGRLQKAIYEAQERTRDAFAEQVAAGARADEANEATRNLWAFPPSEEESAPESPAPSP